MKHQSYNRGHGGSEFSAFLAGALATALVGGYLYFGPNARQNRRKTEAWMLRAKADIMEKTENAKDLTQETYEKIVDEVSEKYGSIKEIGVDRAQKFSDEVKDRWNSLKAEAKHREREMLEDAKDSKNDKK